MIDRTLTDIRAELEVLAAESGEYYVRCGRTGERPVPVDERRFPDRETAVQAVRVARAYRATLRRYDPRTPWYDFVVCETDADPGGRARVVVPTGDGRGLPVTARAGRLLPRPGRRGVRGAVGQRPRWRRAR